MVRFHQDHNKPVLVYRPDLPRPLYTQPHLPNTVPHLRLGDYRPKVVSGYFSPDTRHMEAFRNPESSLNSSEYKHNISSHTRSRFHAMFPTYYNELSWLQVKPSLHLPRQPCDIGLHCKKTWKSCHFLHGLSMRDTVVVQRLFEYRVIVKYSPIDLHKSSKKIVPEPAQLP